MILGTDILLKLVKEQRLVENLSERELNNPEGAGFDFRLKEMYRIKGSAFLGVNERQTPDVETVASFEGGMPKTFTLQPGEYYLMKTMEKVNTPENIVISFKPRTTTFRSGLVLRTGNAAPGYKGELIFGIKNDGPVPVTLEMGCRIAHAQFHTVEGSANKYKGQWQGGRVTTEGREMQM